MATKSNQRQKTKKRSVTVPQKGFFTPPFSARAKIVVIVLAMIPTAFSLRYALALPEPSFRPVCYATKMAPDDPIVFPNQPGKSHLHTFYGSHTVSASATTATLLSDPSGQCGSHFTMDRSAYWVPTLYKDGQAIFADTGQLSVAAYYKRAGGPDGKLIDQPFPQGLRIIAGNPAATTPQDNIWFKCINTVDTGSQNSYGHELPSCKSTESLGAVVEFPDCWNGSTLDSADHRSHMTFSSGSGNVCPATHPVKVPKVTLEFNYWRINGPSSSFAFASGGAYSFHADIFSAWDPRVFAGLVNYCLNFVSGPVDCNPLMFENIDVSSATQAQIDQQLAPSRAGQAAVPTAPATVNAFNQHTQHSSGGGTTPAPAPAPKPVPTPVPTPAAPASPPAASSTPSAVEHSVHEHASQAATSQEKPASVAVRLYQAAQHPLVLLTAILTFIVICITFLYIHRERIRWWALNVRARFGR